ncbi:MAG: metallophosphoesterase [Candidatus Thorarchaeota archaeon]
MESIFDDRGLVIRWDDATALLISDIHLGYEETVSQEKGVEFPLQHPLILQRIEDLVGKYAVTQLYIIGDVKHEIIAGSFRNWEIVPEFMERLRKIVDITIIPGNHDGNLEALLPRGITLTDVHGFVAGSRKEKVGLVHGHAWPSADVLDARLIVTAHNHPTIRRFRDASVPEIGRSSRRKFGGIIPVIIQSKLDKNCVRQSMGILENPEDTDCIMITLPSFNELFSGVPINYSTSKFYGPLFENKCASLHGSEVYSIEGLFLGTVDWLQERFNEMIKSKPRRTDFENGSVV